MQAPPPWNSANSRDPPFAFSLPVDARRQPVVRVYEHAGARAERLLRLAGRRDRADGIGAGVRHTSGTERGREAGLAAAANFVDAEPGRQRESRLHVLCVAAP